MIFLYVLHAEIGLNKLTRIEWHELAKKHKIVAKHEWFKWKGYQLRTNKKNKIGYQSNKKRFSKVKMIESSRRLAKDTTWKSSTFFHESTSHGATYFWNRFCGCIDAYLIFVIFFTLAKFLENKIYTEKRQFFALNL